MAAIGGFPGQDNTRELAVYSQVSPRMGRTFEIGERFNRWGGISQSRRYERHDRRVNGTRYRFVVYELGDVRYADTPSKGRGITVLRVERGNAAKATVVHQYGPPMPSRSW